jgi:hypothetical protein
MWRILTASLGAGRVSGHRTIGVIPGGDQRPAGGAARQQFSAGSAGVLSGRFLRSCRAGHGFVCRSAGAATASPPAAQAGNRTVGVRPAHPVRRQPGHGDYGLRHQPDRMAREITMNFVSIRITTGDVACLAGSCEKATGVHEGKKEGGKQ